MFGNTDFHGFRVGGWHCFPQSAFLETLGSLKRKPITCLPKQLSAFDLPTGAETTVALVQEHVCLICPRCQTRTTVSL